MTCKVMVITEKRVTRYLTDDGWSVWEEESQKVIDHDNSSDRKWLGTHCFWAMRNARKVTTYSMDSVESV